MIIRYSRAAQADIQSIFDYIARENQRAAARVVGLIESSILRLGLFPLSGRRGAIAGTRELVFSRLPYIAVYQIADERVEIIAVFHAAQNRPRGF